MGPPTVACGLKIAEWPAPGTHVARNAGERSRKNTRLPQRLLHPNCRKIGSARRRA